MEQIVRTFVNGVTNKNNTVLHVVANLKNNSSYPDLCILTDNNSPIVKRYLDWFIGNPLPSSYNQLGKVPMVIEAKSFDTEVDWLMLALRKYSKEINLFILLKKQFEACVLLGKYDEAQRILKKIENEICCSLWSLENALLLAELQNGLAGNKKFLNDLISTDLYHDTEFLAMYYSLRVETEGGVQNFNDKVLASFENYNEADREMLLNYFVFKLDPYDGNADFDLKGVLELDFKFSIIDRYLSLIKVCSFFLSGMHQVHTDKLILRIENIQKKISDPKLENFTSFFKKRWSKNYQEDFSNLIMANDFYLQGDFDTAYKLTNEIINENPSNIDALILHAKSSLHLSYKEYTLEDNFIINKIIAAIINLYRKSDESLLFGGFLVKYAYVLESFDISTSLLNILGTEVFNDDSLRIASALHFTTCSPGFYKLFKDIEVQKSFLKEQYTGYCNNITFKYYSNILEGKFEFNNELVPDNQFRLCILNIDSLIATEKYDEVVNILNKLLIGIYEIGYLHEKVLRKIFHCYINLKNLDAAIEIFVHSFMISEYLTTKLDAKLIMKQIKRSRFSNVSPTIFLPIFYSINKAEETDIFNSLKLFLITFNIKLPSQIQIENICQEKKLFIFLFDKVCIPDILKHSDVFKSPKDIYIERINVLNTLKTIDIQNEKSYDDELQLTTKKLIILDGINKLDESKIYINEDGVYESGLKMHENSYNRLLSLMDLFSNNSLESLTEGHGNVDRPAYVNDLFVTSINMLTPSFKELFHSIRNEFLFSKFGLVSYLSTRIRHGILESAIRPVFEKLNLVTQKGMQGDKYLDNSYWEIKLQGIVSSEKIEKFQNVLALFSKNIDSLIGQVLTQKLQIRTESKNKEGLFNFIFKDSDIDFTEFFASTAYLSFKEFVFKVFELLWKRTEENLENIRYFIRLELKEQFVEFLIELEESTQKIIKREIFPEFFINTTICRTDLGLELDKVSRWFLRSNTQMSDFNLSDIIDITYEYLSKSSLHKNLAVKMKLESNVRLNGKFYVHFADLFRLFMHNCLKHSHFEENEIPFEIQSYITNQILHIGITNPLGKLIDKAALKTGLEVRKQQINDVDKLITEGNSGFLKAFKIVKSDFGNETNVLDFFINDDERFEIILEISIKNMTA